MIHNCLAQILRPKLQSLKLNAHQINVVLNDIRIRIESALMRWDDVAFRNSLLFPGLEEASFYRPIANLDCSSFVVMCVRNSLIEDLAASQAATVELGLAKPVLTDDQVPEITSAAIGYFTQADLLAASRVCQENGIETDCFGTLPTEFPHAWHVISSLANSKSGNVSYEASVAPKPVLPQTSGDTELESMVSIVASGIDPTLDSGLLAYLQHIASGEMPYFFSDSFKGITRNTSKLFRVIDFVIGHGATLVTHNYLLGPTFAARRAKLLRPFHFTSEVKEKLSNQTGLCDRHRDILSEIKDALEAGD
ncbi:hypothetical protein [Novipirellula aureliae]|nr:hypothetical protein [Novipirellula aureliae]